MRWILGFSALACALSWAAWLPILLTGGSVEAGEGWPTHLPGLLGPALAAFIVAALEGRRAFADLARRCLALPGGWRAWAVTLSPVAMIGVALVTERIVLGRWPDFAALGLYSGLPELGVLPVLALALVVNGFGEEIGWRGYLLPRLQSKFGAWLGTLAVWPIWLVWHLPLFAFLADFQGMDAITVIFGWGLGLLAGTLVLANVAHVARGSVIAVAIWHLLFNAAAGTGLSAASSAVATTVVIIWAVVLGFVAMRGKSRILSVVTKSEGTGTRFEVV